MTGAEAAAADSHDLDVVEDIELDRHLTVNHCWIKTQKWSSGRSSLGQL